MPEPWIAMNLVADSAAKVCLVVIDGWGYTEKRYGNAILNASCVNMEKLIDTYGCLLVYAHGKHVGLLPGQVGNSEVGHLTIGAGRMVPQDILLVTNAIASGELGSRLDKAGLENVDRLHLIGLVSDGGVHSHWDILKTLLLECRERCRRIFVHFISDGRDTAPRCLERYFQELDSFLKENKCGHIASICGRYYAMDRDNNDDRTMEAYSVMTGTEEHSAEPGYVLDDESSGCVLEMLGLEVLSSDEMLKPTLLTREGIVRASDKVFMFNHRADRMRQLTAKFLKKNQTFTLTEYDVCFDASVVFKRETIKMTLGEAVSLQGLAQTHISESEKKAHVTYFLNGGREAPFSGEKRVIVPSPSVDSYAKTPEMSMGAVCRHVLEEISNGVPFVVCNLAAPDMIGHTGDYEAARHATEATDKIIGEIYERCVSEGYVLIVTADHGNCETMLDESGKRVTKHTSNKVPLIVCDKKTKWKGVIDTPRTLSDVAPTVLKYLGISKPEVMTGSSVV